MKKVLILLLIVFSLLTVTGCQFVTVKDGKSAYDIAVDNGFVGTEKEWLESLNGQDGKSLNIRDIYNEYVKDGYTGSFTDFIEKVFPNTEYLAGESAYQIAVKNGFEGTEQEWIESLRGAKGEDGLPGDRIDLYTLYAKLVELELYDKDYYQFALEYVNNDEYLEVVTSKSLLSAVKVISTNKELSAETDTSNLKGATGAGVIFRLNKSEGECYFITNYHVVYDESGSKIYNCVYVMFYGNERIESVVRADFIGGTAQFDLAVFKITNSDIIRNSDLMAAKMADSDEIKVGESCYAVGNPAGKGIAVSKGIISVDSETITLSDIKGSLTAVSHRVIRTDTPVNSGNSGGGLYNKDGELIGIVNAKNVESSVDDIGYAIPSNVAKYIIENIFKNCDGNENTSVLRCLMGITIQNKASSAVYKDGYTKIIEEVVVAEVNEDGVAFGIVEVGDKILEITLHNETKEVTRIFTVTDICLSAAVGDTVTMKVLRNNVEEVLNIEFKSNIAID